MVWSAKPPIEWGSVDTNFIADTLNDLSGPPPDHAQKFSTLGTTTLLPICHAHLEHKTRVGGEGETESEEMNGALQDDDLWRRAFTANAGLFFDTASDPFLTADDDGGAGLAERAPSPAPTTNSTNNAASFLPMSAPEFAAPVAQAQQQQQQQQPQLQMQQQPTLRVQVRARMVDEVPSIQARPALPPQQQRIMAAPTMSAPVLSKTPVAAAPPAASPARKEPSHDQASHLFMCLKMCGRSASGG